MKIKGYHLTYRRNRESILENGLIPHEKTGGEFINYSPRIFFSINENDLGFDYVNFENVDCWEFEVDQKLIKKDKNSYSKYHYYTTQYFAPENIKLTASF